MLVNFNYACKFFICIYFLCVNRFIIICSYLDTQMQFRNMNFFMEWFQSDKQQNISQK